MKRTNIIIAVLFIIALAVASSLEKQCNKQNQYKIINK